MTGEDTLARVAAVVRRVFHDAEADVTATTKAADVEGWDSLSHGLVLMAIERDFGIRFNPAEVLVVENFDDLRVADLVRAVDARLAAKQQG